MGIAVRDIVAFSEARNNLSRLLDEVCQGAEKIITRNGEPAAALIDAKRLDYYHALEREQGHLMLMDEENGLRSIAMSNCDRFPTARNSVNRSKPTT